MGVSHDHVLSDLLRRARATMINSANGMASSAQAPSSSSSSSANAPPPGLKTYFKTPEGRYKLQYEKGHPSGIMHYVQGKTVT